MIVFVELHKILKSSEKSLIVWYNRQNCKKDKYRANTKRITNILGAETMLGRIITILSEHTEYPKEQMTADTKLSADLGLNSYDVVSLTVKFEDEFGIEIPDKDIKKFQTLGDVAAYLAVK